MTISQAVYNYILPLIPSGLNGFFYLENNNTVKAPYGTMFLIDDPKDRNLLCPSDEGQARFQIDVFDLYHDTGINFRAELETTIQGLRGQTFDDLTIWDARAVNENDRANTVNNLFQFSFELLVDWRK